MNNRLTSTTELVKVLQAGSDRIYGRPSGPSDGVLCGFWDYIDARAPSPVVQLLVTLLQTRVSSCEWE